MASPTRPTDPAAPLKAHLQRGLKATPLCLAVIGWLCDIRAASPYLAEVRRTPEGQVALRFSDETRAEPFGPLLEFLGQITIICQSLRLSDTETRALVALARQRLG